MMNGTFTYVGIGESNEHILYILHWFDCSQPDSHLTTFRSRYSSRPACCLSYFYSSEERVSKYCFAAGARKSWTRGVQHWGLDTFE
jgi:hypothetical protein